MIIPHPLIQRLEPEVDRRPPEQGSLRRRLRCCPECDLLLALPALRPGQKAVCPRCDTPLVRRHFRPAQRSMALALAALTSLLVALVFPFLRFSTQGIDNRIQLLEVAELLIGFDEPIVALTVMLTVVVLPAFFLIAVVWLQFGLLRGGTLPLSRTIARSTAHIYPWMMADVFMIGVMVSLIKIGSMGSFEVGPAFWALCLFEVFLLMCVQSLDPDWLWFALAGEPHAPRHARTGQAAAPQGLGGCPTCGLINTFDYQQEARCRRCGEHYRPRHRHSLQKCWAFVVAATIMYIPANTYPMMISDALGQIYPNTIISGIITMFERGSWFVAAVIFIASVFIPIGKLLLLAWLCIVARQNAYLTPEAATRFYRITDFIGRWSMIDIFVMALMVALVRAEGLVSIYPGPAALAFGAMVILSILAAKALDPRLFWDGLHSNPRPAGQRQEVTG